jgi:hypothetical protein
MPAFIAHLLIARDLSDLPEIKKLVKEKNYFLLGSLGPDLPYYRNVFGTAIGTFFEEKFNPDSPGYYDWGDFFHARTPNLFPMKLIEVIRKDRGLRTSDPNHDQKLSFVLGHLTHMAADQVVHPFVEEVAGPYFVSGRFRRNHRLLEVYQDLLLLEKLESKTAFKTINFADWVKVGRVINGDGLPDESDFGGPPNPQTRKRIIYTEDWLRSFIQRAFLEAYSVILDKDEVEKWVGGFNSVLDNFQIIGPYKTAFGDLNSKKPSENAEYYRDKFKDYLTFCFEPAKELSKKYISAARDFYNSENISEKERRIFSDQFPDIDLSRPLTKA